MGLCIRCFTGEDEPSGTSECGSELAATATDDVESCRAPDRHRRHLGLSQYSVNVWCLQIQFYCHVHLRSLGVANS